MLRRGAPRMGSVGRRPSAPQPREGRLDPCQCQSPLQARCAVPWLPCTSSISCPFLPQCFPGCHWHPAVVCERRMRSCAAALTPVHSPELIIAAINCLLLSSVPLHVSPPLPAPCAAQLKGWERHVPRASASRCPWRLTDLGVRC